MSNYKKMFQCSISPSRNHCDSVYKCDLTTFKSHNKKCWEREGCKLWRGRRWSPKSV